MHIVWVDCLQCEAQIVSYLLYLHGIAIVLQVASSVRTCSNSCWPYQQGSCRTDGRDKTPHVLGLGPSASPYRPLTTVKNLTVLRLPQMSSWRVGYYSTRTTSALNCEKQTSAEQHTPPPPRPVITAHDKIKVTSRLLSLGMLHNVLYINTLLQLYSQTIHVWVAGCWVQFPNDATYASANYGHSCKALFGLFLWGLLVVL